MLSIIIASANPKMLGQIRKNIAETIGVPYEIIAFENSNGAKGMCEVYNEGIDKAKYDMLCFMHEDVAMKTSGWGAVVNDLFARNPKVGIIGVAGSTYKSILPTGWGCIGIHHAERAMLIQSFKYINMDSLVAHANPADEAWARVVAVDGVWMCMRREVVKKYRFDDKTFKRFHCYDLDFCLSAGKEFDIAVTYEVLLHHFSEGKLDRDWMEQTLLLFKKWVSDLPRSITPISAEKLKIIEKRNFRRWVKQLRYLDMDRSIAYEVLHNPHVRRILGTKYFLKFHYTIYAVFSLKKKPTAADVF